MKKLYLYTFLFLLTKNHAYSLEIDKKLLFSILNFSKSKRTLLINKGSESGLEKGDQAKFYIESKGLVARASVLKTSPTRSLWAVFKYRNKNSVKKGKVLKLIITKKIPLTNDVTKRVFKSEVLSGKEDRLPIEKRQKISRSFSSRFLIQKPKGDFSAINDMERPKRKKPIDYSNLREKRNESRFMIKTNFEKLKENRLENGFGSILSEINKSISNRYSSLMEKSVIPILNEKLINKNYKSLEEI